MKTRKSKPRKSPQVPVDWRKFTKSASRHFTLDIDLADRHAEWVLDNIENDTLLVYRPDDPKAMWDYIDKQGNEVVNKRATLPVSVREWLAVGCQVIDEDRNCGPNLGYFTHNAFSVIFDENAWSSPGPAAYLGRIRISPNSYPRDNSDAEHDAHMFVIAHELVHAFDMMRFIVPAVMDWTSFWKIALKDGGLCDAVKNSFMTKSLFLDDYGSENELAMIEDFWPSHAKRWFDAFQTHRRVKDQEA